MDQADDFFPRAVRLAEDVLGEIVLRGGLHLRPETLSRAAARQCRVRLSFLMNFVRQLIFLMAAGLMNGLAPAKPRAASARPAPPVPGAEDVTASFGRQPWRFALAPPLSRALPVFPDAPRAPRPETVPSRLFIDKVVALRDILKDPMPHARRMARSLGRWKSGGELHPVSVPALPRFPDRCHAGAFGRGLSHRLNVALAEAWKGSG